MEKTKRKICWIRVFKNLSYFMIPLLFILLLACLMALVNSTNSMRKGQTYFESVDFADSYAESIEEAISEINGINQIYANIEEEYGEGLYGERLIYGYYSYSIIGDEDNGVEIPIYYLRFQSNFNYLIIDHENNSVYTNVEDSIDNNTIEAIKSHILSNRLYWQYANGEIDTSIQTLKSNMDENTDFYRKNLKDGQYEIYTCILEDVPNYDNYFYRYWVYNIISTLRELSIYIIPGIIFLFGIMILVILLGIGRTAREEGIHLNFLDKWSLEIVLMLSIPFYVFSFLCCLISINNGPLLELIFARNGIRNFLYYKYCFIRDNSKKIKDT